jgi:hypothetical protein
MEKTFEKFSTLKASQHKSLAEGFNDYLNIKDEELEKREKEQKLMEIREFWQKTLDELFKIGDFTSLKLLLRAQPELKPNLEIVQSRLNELVLKRPLYWGHIISDIKKIFNMEPDSVIVEQEFFKLFMKSGNKSNIFDELKSFKDCTGLKPKPEHVQKKYRTLLNRNDLCFADLNDFFNNIESLTGVKADPILFDEVLASGDINYIIKYAPLFGVEISGDMVQSIYEKYFIKNGCLSVDIISRLPQKPSAELMRKVYANIIEKRGDGWIIYVQKLEKATGEKPSFTNEQIQSVFADFLSKGQYGRSDHVGVEQFIELTGIKPSTELIIKRALQVVDEGHQYIDRGKVIKNGIQMLEVSTGSKVEIPEHEIQNRYWKAIEDKKFYIIINLYGSFGIKPAIDSHVVQKFLNFFIGRIDSNLIFELEKIFGIKLEVQSADVFAKFDEALLNLDFDRVKKIQQNTGFRPDRKRLEESLVKIFEKAISDNSYNNNDWGKQIIELFQAFEITFPEKVAIEVYEQLMESKIIDIGKLKRVNKISNVPIPKRMAQKAYQKIIAVDATSLNKLVELIGVVPEFDEIYINQLYKKWIFDGSFYMIKSTKNITGIKLQLDEETLQHISNILEMDLSVYDVKEKDGETKFDISNFKVYLSKLIQLVEITGIFPSFVKVQLLYSTVLENMEDCFPTIKNITKTIGIEPQFTPEQIQAKGEHFLEEGDLANFERLLVHGGFSYTQVNVAKCFQALLDTCRRYDGYYQKYYYVEGWWKKLLKLKELSGIAPSVEHLSQLFTLFIEFNQSKGDYYNFINKAMHFFAEQLEVEVSGVLAQKIYEVFLKDRNIKAIVTLKRETKIVPKIPMEILQEVVDDFLRVQEYGELSELKESLEINILPATISIVQSIYVKLLSTEAFASEYSSERMIFLKIYSLTGISTQLSENQLAQIYEKVDPSSWQSLSQALGREPSVEVVQNQYYKALTGSIWGFNVENINIIKKYSGVVIEEATVQKVLDFYAQKAEIKKMIKLIEATGVNPKVSNEAVQKGYHTKIENKHSFSDLGDLINYFYDVLGIAPNQENLDLAYANLLDREAYCYRKEGDKNSPLWFDVLKNKFGMPSENGTQRIYYNFLSAIEENDPLVFFRSSFPGLPIADLYYVKNFTKVAPNLAEISRTQGLEIEKIKQKLQTLYKYYFSSGGIDDIAELNKLISFFNIPFQLSIGEAQLIYAKILYDDSEKQRNQYYFMIEHSGFYPDMQLILDRYNELFIKLQDNINIHAKINNILKFNSVTRINPPENLVVEGILRSLEIGSVDLSIIMKKEFLKNDEDFLNSLEVIKAARSGLVHLLQLNNFKETKGLIREFLADRSDIYFDVAEQVLFDKISSGDIENAHTIQNIFGLKNICEKFKEKYPDRPVLDNLYLYFGDKSNWQNKLGEEPVKEFLDVLPKSKERDEKRNAFTHNEYDRTSEFLQYLNKYELFGINQVDLFITTDFVEKYGLAKNILLFEYFKNLHYLEWGLIAQLPEEQIYDEIVSLEILEKKYKDLQNKVFSSEEIKADYLKTLSHFEITLLAQITGKNTHRFDGGRPSFDKIIQDFITYSENNREFNGSAQEDYYNQADDEDDYDDYDDYDYNQDDYDEAYNQATQSNEYVPTPEAYKPFELQANKVEYEVDRSTLEKPDSSYNVLKGEILEVFDQKKLDKDKFQSLREGVIEKINNKIKELEDKTDNQYIAQQKEKLAQIVEKLKIIEFKEKQSKEEIGSQSYDELLVFLLDLDKSIIERSGLQKELRQIVFRKMLDHNYGTVDRVERMRTSMQGDLSALAVLHLLDLIDNFAKDHILNLEKNNKEKYWTSDAWDKIKSNQKIDSKFKMNALFNKPYKELKEVADKIKALDSGKGNFKIQCCPDRGFIGEMSGYLADVCYTAVYPLLSNYPNLVPYKFITEQDSDNKEFLGSVLVFELEDADNNKVALLRGFDIPREHEVNIGEFVEGFIEKISPSLKARGVKKIIIPGDDGAISNYYLTISHMHKNYINGKDRISLANPFAFNGYDITDNCYVVRVF